MSAQAVSDREAIEAAYAGLEAAQKTVDALSLDVLTHSELLELMQQREAFNRRQCSVDHQILNRLAAEADPKALGGKNLAEVLATGLRISTQEAHQRLKHAALLGPRTALTGEVLPPLLPETAAAQQRGQVGSEHVRIIERFFHQLPEAIDYQTREQAEAQLAQIAAGFKPEELRKAAERLACLLNQDGHYSDADRARKRHFTIGRQQADAMSPVNGLLDPQARATLDAVLAKWAAPGMCNPADESPCVDGEPTDEHVRTDTRSQGQRNHDALIAMGRSVLSSGELGNHNGLPATIIVSTTLHDLEAGTGHAVTAAGTLLPMSEVIRQAAHAHHYLYIYDKHTSEPLYLGRTKRLASQAQRIVLYGLERGCTCPGCSAPAYWCQVHHAEKDWAQGGQSNITDETLACGPHNRMVTEYGWTTRKRKDGRTEWIPPPHLDTGQPRVNNYHHPEKYLVDDDDDDDP